MFRGCFFGSVISENLGSAVGNLIHWTCISAWKRWQQTENIRGKSPSEELPADFGDSLGTAQKLRAAKVPQSLVPATFEKGRSLKLCRLWGQDLLYIILTEKKNTNSQWLCEKPPELLWWEGKSCSTPIRRSLRVKWWKGSDSDTQVNSIRLVV